MKCGGGVGESQSMQLYILSDWSGTVALYASYMWLLLSTPNCGVEVGPYPLQLALVVFICM